MEIESILGEGYPIVEVILAIGGAYYISNELITDFLYLSHDLTVFLSLLTGIIVFANYDSEG